MASAFSLHYNNLANRLLTKATVSSNNFSKNVYALWDTGATNTCISEELVKEFGLSPLAYIKIQTPSGTKDTGIYVIDLLLPNNVVIKNLSVCGSEIGKQGLGVLVGMDIINTGDFAISNFNHKTYFSFRMPSLKHCDYVQEMRLSKIIGQKHGTKKKK